MNEEAMELEKSKLACIDTLDIIDYIKQSVEILMHMRMDEFELFKNNWNAQEKMRKAQVAHEKEADHSNLSVTVYNLASVHEAMGRLPEAAMGYERGGNPIPRLHRHLHLLSSLLLLPLLSASA